MSAVATRRPGARPTRRIIAVVVVFSSLLLAGCSEPQADADSQQPTEGIDPHKQLGGPVLAADPGSSEKGYPASQVMGRVSLKADCLTLAGSLVLWPEGTTWDASSQAVQLLDGTRIVSGDSVTASGALVPPSVASKYTASEHGAFDVCVEALGATDIALISQVTG